jgi:hypothetical protein
MIQSIVIKDKTAMLIVIIIFFIMVGLILACASAPKTKQVWYKPGWTQEGWAKDKYDCLQQSQQRESSATGGFCSGYLCVPGRSDSNVVTNWALYNACMEARGWSLRTVNVN